MHINLVRSLAAFAALACLGCRDDSNLNSEGEGECDVTNFEGLVVGRLELLEYTIWDDGEPGGLAVARGDDPNEYELEVRAFAPGTNGARTFRSGLRWQLEPPDAPFELREVQQNDESVRAVWASVDFFDNSNVEPTAIVTVCVANSCPTCPEGCELLEVCTDPVPLMAVVNLQGEWEMSGDTFPPGQYGVVIDQTGRQIAPIGYDAEPVVVDDTVSFTILFDEGKTCYDGMITPTRDEIAGDVWDCVTQDPLGVWMAYRVGE